MTLSQPTTGSPVKPVASRLILLAILGLASFACAPLSAQPASDGQWTSVFEFGPPGGIEAIHVSMLPTGKVMFWQTWRESIGLWDPATQQFSATPFPLPGGASSYNPFCAGHTWLPDGRLMVVGGHITNNNGSNRANIYNPFTNTWANNVPNMPNVPAGAPYGAGRNGRWYPSATTLGNGDVLVLSGDMNGNAPAGQSDTNPLPQVYELATNSWRNLTTAYKTLPLYPRTFLAPDGRVVSLAGNSDETEFLDTSGTGSWSYLEDTLDSNLANYGPAVMYDTGKIAYIGGGYNPTRNVSMIDLNDATPAWRYAGGGTVEPPVDSPYVMAQPRRQNNATILADGTVLISGGSSLGGPGQFGFNDPTGQIAVSEIWNPETEEVTQVAAASSVYRGYHSAAMLLPDGRVLMTGGNHDLPLPGGGTQYIENKSAEIYSPAYLFAEDGAPAVRPTVTAAPVVAELGDTIFVQTPDAADIAKALWIVPGSVTHAQDWTQRANILDFTAVDGGLNIALPASGNEAPPGYYMLFLVNDQGTPSVAKWIRATPNIMLDGDFNDDGVVDAADYAVWRDGLDTKYTADDYELWKSNFGATAGAAAGAGATASVPEPASLALLVATVVVVAARVRTRS